MKKDDHQEELGMIQVYTGNGKGKTTAALGLALRALGAGKRVMFLQFLKAPSYSEHKILPQFAPQLIIENIGKPFFVVPEGIMSEEERSKWEGQVVIFPPGNPPAEYQKMVDKGLARAKEVVSQAEFDIVVLDEIIVALHFGLVSWPKLEEIIDAKHPKTELILTGRGATQPLIDKADLVTEMKEIKHYYHDLGLEARVGIEH
jgi:cob(I)alamin adenosyltransferase